MDETSQGRMISQAGDSPPGGGRGRNPRCISPLASTSSPPPALLFVIPEQDAIWWICGRLAYFIRWEPCHEC
jgi:hypothetical protein